MKNSRQECILEIIRENDVETQDELAEKLQERGIHAAQATISRDLKKLNLKKVPTADGRQKYALQTEEVAADEKYIRILKNGYLSMDQAMNLVVIRTASGMAMAVAAALDNMAIPGIVGCIAGDDTIMCAAKSAQDAARVMEKLKSVMKS